GEVLDVFCRTGNTSPEQGTPNQFDDRDRGYEKQGCDQDGVLGSACPPRQAAEDSR
ncbi:MAG: hypothetical protein JRF71_11590, partial [Deltaproteobacteria bacterium]|nr:hypothetical protein [Deltaproteobacteria bacterium]